MRNDGDDVDVARTVVVVAARRRADHVNRLDLAERVDERLEVAGQDSRELDHRGHASNATLPAATVIRTRPRSVFPSSHEFAESERKLSSRTRHVALGSSRTRFAGAPTAMRGGSSPYARAGPADMRSSSVASGSRPGSTRCVWSAAQAVSRPVTPNGAASNGASFSWRACGA